MQNLLDPAIPCDGTATRSAMSCEARKRGKTAVFFLRRIETVRSKPGKEGIGDLVHCDLETNGQQSFTDCVWVSLY